MMMRMGWTKKYLGWRVCGNETSDVVASSLQHCWRGLRGWERCHWWNWNRFGKIWQLIRLIMNIFDLFDRLPKLTLNTEPGSSSHVVCEGRMSHLGIINFNGYSFLLLKIPKLLFLASKNTQTPKTTQRKDIFKKNRITKHWSPWPWWSLERGRRRTLLT